MLSLYTSDYDNNSKYRHNRSFSNIDNRSFIYVIVPSITKEKKTKGKSKSNEHILRSNYRKKLKQANR